MQKTQVFFLAAVVSCLLLGGCVEHAGYTAGIAALQKDDIKQCAALKEAQDVKECYLTFADGKNDPKLCLQAPDPAACVSDYAGKRQLMSACDVLTNPAQKYSCVARVAGDQTGRSIEEIIADFRSRGASKQCLAKCQQTSTSCETDCHLKEKVLQPYEVNGTIYYPVDADYVDCMNTCKTGYSTCREDCLQGGGDPNFHN